MRLIELTDLYQPAIGGLERFVLLLSEGLAGRGHEVHVVTSAIPGVPTVERSGGVTVHRIPLLYQKLAPWLGEDAARPFHPPAPDPLFRRLLAEVVREVRPDVIHAHAWSVFSCLARNFPPTPVLVTAHDYGLVCAKRSLVLRSGASCPGPSWQRCGPCASSQYGLAKGNVLAAASLSSLRLLKKVATFTAVSDYVANRLSPTIGQVVGQPVSTLNSFVPDGLYESGWQAQRPDFLPAQDGYLLYVGQLSRHKGVDVLLDAYRRLPSSSPPLVMLGTPHPTCPAPESLPVGVTMRTSVAHPSVIAAMVRAACVIVPSVWPEPLPMTVSEAHNCGVPVIASAVGGIPEQILDGQTGWLVPAADDRALADRLVALLASGDRASMGRAGRLHGRRFTAAHGIGLFEEALQTASQTAF